MMEPWEFPANQLNNTLFNVLKTIALYALSMWIVWNTLKKVRELSFSLDVPIIFQ